MLEGQVSDSKWPHIKAIDRKTGELAAWASWNTPNDAGIRERDERSGERRAASESKVECTLSEGEFEFPLGLPMYVQEDTERWLESGKIGKRTTSCAL